MNCKTCDYSLWALKTRQCPECGRPFMPSEYEFVPGSVRFACPHCDQSYYGTGANGHLIPAEFNCVNCRQPVRMDEMVLFPAEGVQERQTRPEGQPWLERGERGRVGSWFRTLGLALVGPQRLMRYTPVESSVGSAWWFALITQFLYSMVGFFPLMLFPLLVISAMRGGGPPAATGMGAVFGGMLIAAWLGPMVLIAFWGLVTHGILRITGGAEYSIGRTYQAICYSSGANVLMAVPCIGLHLTVLGISSVWWIVSAVLMVKEGQRVHGGRAALAVLVFPVLLLVGTVALVTLSVMAVSRATTNLQVTATSPAFSQRVDAIQIQTALTSYASQHRGRLPGHVLELLNGNYLSDPSVFLLSDAEERQARVPLDDQTLADFLSLSLEERRRVIGAAAAAAGTSTAYRLGDVVFTYPGISPATADPKGELWLFVLWPDAASGGDTSETVVTVVDGSGPSQLTTTTFDAAWAQQNELRAQNRLRPLPHPKDVLHPRVVPVAASEPTLEAEEQ